MVQVGLRPLAVHDAIQGTPVPAHLLYPTTAPAVAVQLGPYPVELARDAPVAGRALPVVALSHGEGGSPWTSRGLALALARAGCAVVMIEHPGSSRSDGRLAGTAADLVNRPRHVRLALDAALADPALAADGVAVIGHSLGGYTALAVAGGHPLALPDQTPDGVAHPLDVDADPRVRTIVLLAPAVPWFMAPGALADVHATVWARTGEHDALTPPYFVEGVLRGLPARAALDLAVVPGAGHFSFLSPFPPLLASQPGFAPAQDPPGFDRAAYQARLAAELVARLAPAAAATAG